MGHQILRGPEDHRKHLQLLENVKDSIGWYLLLNYFRSYTYIRTRITARPISTRNTNRARGSFLTRLSCRSLFSWWTLKARTSGKCCIKRLFHKTRTYQNACHLHCVQALRSSMIPEETVTGFETLDTYCWSWKTWHPTLSSLSGKTHNASLSCSSSWARRTIGTLQATTAHTEHLGLY